MRPAALQLEHGGDLGVYQRQVGVGGTQALLQHLDLAWARLLRRACAVEEVVEELLQLIAVAAVAAAQDHREAAEMWLELLDDDVHRLVHLGGEQDGLAACHGIEDDLRNGEGLAGAGRADHQRERAMLRPPQYTPLCVAQLRAREDWPRVLHGATCALGRSGLGGVAKDRR